MLQCPESELLYMVVDLKCLCTCLKLFHSCNCFGSLNIAHCNHLNHSETLCMLFCEIYDIIGG
jgi:hypothetical protein